MTKTGPFADKTVILGARLYEPQHQRTSSGYIISDAVEMAKRCAPQTRAPELLAKEPISGFPLPIRERSGNSLPEDYDLQQRTQYFLRRL